MFSVCVTSINCFRSSGTFFIGVLSVGVHECSQVIFAHIIYRYAAGSPSSLPVKNGLMRTPSFVPSRGLFASRNELVWHLLFLIPIVCVLPFIIGSCIVLLFPCLPVSRPGAATGTLLASVRKNVTGIAIDDAITCEPCYMCCCCCQCQQRQR